MKAVEMGLDFFALSKEEASPEPFNTVSEKIQRRVA